MTGSPQTSPPPGAAPCAAAQQAAAVQCAEADRLADVARQRAAQLREARRRRADLAWTGQRDNELADRRSLREAKVEAQRAYHEQLAVARTAGAVTVAAANWLAGITELNRAARVAVSHQAQLNHETTTVEALVRRLELEADAARIAAAAAREHCKEARNRLAECEGAAASNGSAVGTRTPVGPPADAAVPELAPAAPRSASHHEPSVVGLLRGERDMLGTVVVRLAEEIGQDAGRLHLLMLELLDGLIDAAGQACAFDFPPHHPFWGQFSRAEARAVAAALATLGRTFDGREGWANGVPPNPRELAMAISLAGRDPRSVRRSPSAAEIDALWRGTTIAAPEHLLGQAPDLRLEAIVALLGPRADGLTELWDNWSRVRPLLLGSDPSLAP